MISTLNILAEGRSSEIYGIPPQVIFGAVVFVLWSLGALLNKSAKPPAGARPSKDVSELAAIRRRMLEEQARQKQAILRPGSAKAHRKSQSAARPASRAAVATPPPIPTAASAATQAAAITRRPPAEAAMKSSKGRHRTSETARNVRLLLQRNVAAEAFVLAEIFGPPKGLQ